MAASSACEVKAVRAVLAMRARVKRNRFMFFKFQFVEGGKLLNSGVALLIGADADGGFDSRDEHFAVADLAGLGGLDDARHGGVHLFVREDEFKFDLGQKVHGVFAAAIDFRVTILTTEALDFGDRHSLNADFAEGVFDLFKLEGFDDGFDFLHSILCVGLVQAELLSQRAFLVCLPEA